MINFKKTLAIISGYDNINKHCISVIGPVAQVVRAHP